MMAEGELDVLGAKFYCSLLQENYDMMCKSLLLDKQLYAQLINRCGFTLKMVNEIKNRGSFSQKVRCLILLLETKIKENPSYMREWCRCLENVGQGPLAKHVNLKIKLTLEKRIDEAKAQLKLQPRKKSITDGRYQRKTELNCRSSISKNPRRSVGRYTQNIYRMGLNKHPSEPLPYIQSPFIYGQMSNSYSILSNPFRAYNILSHVVGRLDMQTREMDAIKKRMRRLELDTSYLKRTIGRTIAGSRPIYIDTHPARFKLPPL